MTKKVSIVIPAKDEEEGLALLLDEIESTKSDIKFPVEVIVVNDHSQDRTAEVAIRKGALCLQNRLPKGKGYALRFGFEVAQGDYIVMMDADYSHSAKDIPRLITPLEEGSGLVIGSRIIGGTDEYTPIRALGNVIFTLAFSLLFKQNLTDALNGFKAFRRSLIKDFSYSSKDFEIEIELLANALRMGYRIVEVSSHERKRYAGEVKSRIFLHGLKFLFRIFKEWIKGINL